MAEENLEIKKRQPRKTIGGEGSRKQTVFVFLLLLGLGLIMYLPGRLRRPRLPVRLPEWGGSEVITIRKSESDPAAPGRVKPDLPALIGGSAGDWGIWVKSLDGQEEIRFNQDLILTAASVIKLPVLVVYYQQADQGKINPGDEYILAEADRWEYGTGSMQYQPAGTRYTYQEVAGLVANQSDNMGMEVLIKKLGGYARVQQLVHGLGLVKTDLKENETTAAEAGKLFFDLARGKLLSPASREELFNNLTDTVNEERIPAGMPEDVRVVHKFGSEAGVVNDCGLVESTEPYVICILTANVSAGEAEARLPQISQAVWEWLGD